MAMDEMDDENSFSLGDDNGRKTLQINEMNEKAHNFLSYFMG
jgi:hypothetical protein